MRYYHMLMRDLCKDFTEKAVYETVKTSMKAFIAWCKLQGIEVGQLFWEIVMIMDRKLPKRKSLIFLGLSNAGKTLMMTRPLCDLARFVGRVTNTNAAPTCKTSLCFAQDLVSSAPDTFEND